MSEWRDEWVSKRMHLVNLMVKAEGSTRYEDNFLTVADNINSVDIFVVPVVVVVVDVVVDAFIAEIMQWQWYC